MSRAERIKARIEVALPGAKVSVVDETALHIGHRELVDEATPVETHLIVRVVAEQFSPMRALDRTRSINKLIEDEFEMGLHALTLTCKTPKEAATSGDSLQS